MFNISINIDLHHKIKKLPKKEQETLLNAINFMELSGQVGEPFVRQMSIWKYRFEQFRIFYKLEKDGILIFEIKRDSED